MTEYHALVYSLREGKCKIVPASELLILQPDLNAVKLNPKNEKAFKKGLEYGRIEIVDGNKKMVRYFIFAMNKDLQTIRDTYSKDKVRFVPPKRLSTSAVVEDINTYKFPNERSDCLKARQNAKNTKLTAGNSGGMQIFKEFKKKNPTIPSSSISSQSTNLKADSVNAKAGPSKQSNPDSSNNQYQSTKLKADSVNAKAGPSNQSNPDSFNQYSVCGNFSHLKLQIELDEALTKLENAYLEIRRLRAMGVEQKRNDDIHASLAGLQSDVTEMKGILKTLERVEVANSANYQSQLCDLQSNLVSSDDEEEKEEVDKSKFKVEDQHLIDKQAVLKLEAERNKFFCYRVDRLCDMICENKVANYSLTGFSATGKGLQKFTPRMVQSVTKILKAMQWPHLQEVTVEKVKARISRYCCAARAEDEVKAKEVAEKLTGAFIQKRKSLERIPKFKKFKVDDKPETDVIQETEDNEETEDNQETVNHQETDDNRETEVHAAGPNVTEQSVDLFASDDDINNTSIDLS